MLSGDEARCRGEQWLTAPQGEGPGGGGAEDGVGVVVPRPAPPAERATGRSFGVGL